MVDNWIILYKEAFDGRCKEGLGLQRELVMDVLKDMLWDLNGKAMIKYD